MQEARGREKAFFRCDSCFTSIVAIRTEYFSCKKTIESSFSAMQFTSSTFSSRSTVFFAYQRGSFPSYQWGVSASDKARNCQRGSVQEAHKK